MTKNIADWERMASIAAGAALLFAPYGKRRGAEFALRALGAGLIWRGTSGYCPVYEAVDRSGRDYAAHDGLDETRDALGGSNGVNVTHVLTIAKPIGEVYGFWRNFENLPKVMAHLEAVRTTSPGRSHWEAKGPMGTTVQWDAETINDEENKLIAWRSLEGADVVSAGSVNFREAPAGRGTEVRVNLQYSPPAGKVGAAVAWLFGRSAAQEIRGDLKRLKQYLEAGEIATVEGQPAGGSRARQAASGPNPAATEPAGAMS